MNPTQLILVALVIAALILIYVLVIRWRDSGSDDPRSAPMGLAGVAGSTMS